MNRLATKLIFALVALFFLSYVVFQAWRYFYAPFKTETVYEYTVNYNIPVRGIAIRDETVLAETRSGVESYVVDDGERVSIGQTIAEYHESGGDGRNIHRYRQIESEIKSLRDAQETTAFSGVDMINRDIKERLCGISRMAAGSRFDDIDALRGDLMLLLNKKQIASGRESGFQTRISVLEQELGANTATESSGRVATLEAPVTGYFVRAIDGYESQLSRSSIAEFGIDDFFGLLESDPPSVPEGSGKLITNQNWVFAGLAPEKHTLDPLREGQQVNLRIEVLGRTIPAKITGIILSNGDERGVVLLESDYISGELAGLRKADASIRFDQVSGLRVNVASLRFQGDKRGVYVVEKNVVRFKLIDPVYEDANYVLSRINYVDSGDSEHLCMYDQIITKGNDLYDGKVIQ